MPAGRARLGFAIMADDALGLSGECERPLADQIQGGGPIVTVSTKGRGNHGTPNHKKGGQTGHQNHRRAEEMSGVPQKSAHSHNTRGA